jgi:hypothetical protein
MADWITEAVNLVLERLDRIATALEHIAGTEDENADM